ncbi:MAG TPA: hypothetical protein VFJ85_12365 [Acidimicrobiales bacterium]|nr:hypothetical protein [Acidimicrobiales bacterium]
MTDRDKAVSVLLVVVISVLLVLGWGLLPTRAAGHLKCEGPIRGSDPLEFAKEGYLVHREAAACSSKGGSRMTIILIVGAVFLVLGVSAVLLPESNFERMAFGGEAPEDVYEMP